MAAAPKYNYPLEGFRRRPSELSIDSAGSGSGWRLDPTAVFEAGGKHGALSKLPIPDLRFESAFVASISPYIQRQGTTQASQSGKDAAASSLVPGQPRQADLINDPIQIHWPSIALVIVRDQLFMPLVNGLAWTMASLVLVQGWKKLFSR